MKGPLKLRPNGAMQIYYYYYFILLLLKPGKLSQLLCYCNSTMNIFLVIIIMAQSAVLAERTLSAVIDVTTTLIGSTMEKLGLIAGLGKIGSKF